jgi:hypothetical protein
LTASRNRDIGLSQQVLPVGRDPPARGDAHTRLDAHLPAGQLKGRADRGARSLGDAESLALATQALAQDHELVAAVPGHGVAGTEHPGEPAGDLDQECVPRLVAEAVVHALEPV